MKKIVVLFVLIYSSCGLSEYNGINHTAAWLLASDDSSLIKLGAKITSNQNVRDPKVLDIAAYQISEKIGYAQNIDTVSWLAVAIEESKNARYAAFMQDMIPKAKDEKTLRHIKSAAESSKQKSPEIFDLAKFDLQTVRNKLKNSTNVSVSREGFKSVKVNDDLEVVIKKTGSLPGSYDDETVYIHQPFVGRIPTQRLVVVYDGLGAFRMDLIKKVYAVETIYNELSLDSDIQDGPGQEIIKMLANYSPDVYRQGAKRICAENQFSNSVLDVAARRIWVDRNGQDSVISDGLAWTAKCIGVSGNPRYKSFLQKVANESKNKKLQKYAKGALVKLLNADVEQFTISQ
jgi:hypothetical protein